MRHLWSLIAGLVLAPLTWVLLALAQDGSARTVNNWEERAFYDTAQLIRPAGYLAAVAVLLGLLATLRVSPLGPLAAGLLLTTVYGLMFVDPFRVHDALPTGWSVFGDRVSLLVPLDNGTLGLVGVLLLMAVFSAQRWRRWPVSGGPAEVAAPEPPAGSPEIWAPPERAPSEPAPAEPTLVKPTPAEPTPVKPTPAEPTPPEPTPVEPTPPDERDLADEPAAADEPPPVEGPVVTEKPATDEPATDEDPPPGEEPVAEEATANGADAAATGAEATASGGARRRPTPRPRRAEPGERATPAESPWLAPPRPAGKPGPPE